VVETSFTNAIKAKNDTASNTPDITFIARMT